MKRFIDNIATDKNKLSELDRDEYERAMLIELFRYAELGRDDWDTNEEVDLSLISMWYLLNPLGLKGRDKMERDFTRTELYDDRIIKRKVKFTSHPHHNEPLVASPDDILVYHRIGRKTKSFAHYITDRFNLKKIF